MEKEIAASYAFYNGLAGAGRAEEVVEGLPEYVEAFSLQEGQQKLPEIAVLAEDGEVVVHVLGGDESFFTTLHAALGVGNIIFVPHPLGSENFASEALGWNMPVWQKNPLLDRSVPITQERIDRLMLDLENGKLGVLTLSEGVVYPEGCDPQDMSKDQVKPWIATLGTGEISVPSLIGVERWRPKFGSLGRRLAAGAEAFLNAAETGERVRYSLNGNEGVALDVTLIRDPFNFFSSEIRVPPGRDSGNMDWAIIVGRGIEEDEPVGYVTAVRGLLDLALGAIGARRNTGMVEYVAYQGKVCFRSVQPAQRDSHIDWNLAGTSIVADARPEEREWQVASVQVFKRT